MDFGDANAVDDALDALNVGLEHLVKLAEDHRLETIDDAQLIKFMQGFERLRNRLSLVDHRLIIEAGRRALPDTLCRGSLPRLLAATIRVSMPEAVRRVGAAEALAERISMTGEPLAPIRPHLAEAQRHGEVSPEQVDIVTRALASVDRGGFDPDDIDAGEQLLTRFASRFGPKELKRLADKVVDAINPDGSQPDEKLQRDRRYLRLRPTRDGGYAGEFRLTAGAGTKLQAVLGPLAKPRINATETDTGRRVEEPDPRHHGQRMHDALEDVCDRLLRSDAALPEFGGTPATVIVTIDADDLEAKTGYGFASDGTRIPTGTLHRLTDSADIYTAVLNSNGEVLRLGRTRRIASRSQTVALYARDGGCSFPGCDTSPEWCERHHIVPWIDGGPTDLDNLTLLCRYHHHNFAGKGWDCALNGDGLPEWRPPWWVDHNQTPLVNSRIRGSLTARQHRRQQASRGGKHRSSVE